MAPTLRPGKSRWRGLGQLTPWLLLVAGLLMVRLSKGAGFSRCLCPAQPSVLAWVLPSGNGLWLRPIWRSALACSCWKRTTGACVLCWSFSNKAPQRGKFRPL